MCKRSILTQIKSKTCDWNTVKWKVKQYHTVWRVPYSNRKIIETDCGERLCVWCLAPLSATFQLYRGGLVLLVEETGIPGENHRPTASHWQTLSHYVVSSTPRLNEIIIHNVSGDRHWLHR